MKTIQTMLARKQITSSVRGAATCTIPRCLSCVIAKAKRRPWRNRRERRSLRGSTKRFHPLTGHLRKSATASVDHFSCSEPGLIPQVKGFLRNDTYCGGAIFVDNKSGVGYLHLQSSLDAAQTVAGKINFERFMASHGYYVGGYKADNGIFADNVFRDHVLDEDQDMNFCGVGAHHQNAIAERRIGVLSDHARALLHHATLMWPEQIDSKLWPFAMRVANFCHNHTPDSASGVTPMQVFTNTYDADESLKDLHTFGCPVVVLRSDLMDRSGSVPRWDTCRARVGIYVGMSNQHATNCPLILNPVTGHVSAQFHVVFDDDFSLVPALRDSDLTPPNWKSLFESKCEHFTDPADDEQFASLDHLVWDSSDLSSLDQPTSVAPNDKAIQDHSFAPPTQQDLLPDGLPTAPADPISNSAQQEPSPDRPPRRNPSADTFAQPPPDISRRGRIRQPSLKAREAASTVADLGLYALYADATFALQATFELFSEELSTSLDAIHPFAFAAKQVDSDTLTLAQAMKQPDKVDFIRAMAKEINDHQSRNHWKVVHRSTIEDPVNKPLPAVWSMRRKRRYDRTVYKHKARLCVGGHRQQEGINFYDTYSPVVQWMTVRLLLILSILDGLETRQVDFVLAFPQAEPDTPLYMDLPKGARFSDVPDDAQGDYCLKLLRNLYGSKQGSHLWWEHLKDSLIERMRFTQSAIDPCAFYRRDLILLVYVDDCLAFSAKRSVLDAFVAELQANYVITDEGEVSEYLGIKVIRHPDGRFELLQTGLIDSIIEAVGLQDDKATHDTPALSKTLLHKDPTGLPRRTTWNYRSVVGMLNFLCASTRPELAFSVHQCARFSQDPKLSHELAILRIVKYLKATREKGLIFKPDSSKSLDCYVDADFAGSWSHADVQDASSVLSRSGYVIMFARCPIMWVSKLQTEIALSTTESEYISLSQSLRDVIPLMNLLQELQPMIRTKFFQRAVHCTVFEDNEGALELARTPKMRPRTKHIALKYHHFREHVRRGTIIPEPINTKDQIADLFTKPLARDQFQILRRRLSGW